MADERKVPVKILEKVLPGVYANGLVVRHTHEEFVLDFINRFPPRGVVAARVIISPGHLKRILDAIAASVAASGAGPGRQTPAPIAAAMKDQKTTIPDGVLAGVYANQMMINHSGEEVLLDFVSLFPPQGVVTARVFASPGHLQRMLAALKENFARYEAVHGKITPVTMPPLDTSYIN